MANRQSVLCRQCGGYYSTRGARNHMQACRGSDSEWVDSADERPTPTRRPKTKVIVKKVARSHRSNCCKHLTGLFWSLSWCWKVLIVLLAIYYFGDLPAVVSDISFIVCHSGTKLLRGMWALTPRYLQQMRIAAAKIEGEHEVQGFIKLFGISPPDANFYGDNSSSNKVIAPTDLEKLKTKAS